MMNIPPVEQAVLKLEDLESRIDVLVTLTIGGDPDFEPESVLRDYRVAINRAKLAQIFREITDELFLIRRTLCQKGVE